MTMSLMPALRIIEEAEFRRYYGLSRAEYEELPAHEHKVLSRWFKEVKERG